MLSVLQRRGLPDHAQPDDLLPGGHGRGAGHPAGRHLHDRQTCRRGFVMIAMWRTILL